ncbi:MAG: flagellar biosynthesis protein FlhB [Chloroflexota bacterium]
MSERTEAATPYRRQEARDKGQVAKSVEINSALMMVTTFWLLTIITPYTYNALSTLMQRSFSALSTTDITLTALHSEGLAIGGLLVQAVAPLTLALLLVSVVANLAQVGFMFSPKAIQLDPNKINPLNGFKRIFSGRGFVELIKSLLKVAVIGLVVYLALRDNYASIAAASRMSLNSAISNMAGIGILVGRRVGIVMVVIAAVDYFYQRWEFEKSLRMTKQEIKEEMKRQENPQMKARIRSRQRQLAMSRMMAAVPQADVVITNPTHIAVALRYEQGKMQAPVVVAKGERLVAERIKEKAQAHEVPLVENKPLARTLFKSVEIGQTIPLDLYAAVAEVLAFVYRLKSPFQPTKTGR